MSSQFIDTVMALAAAGIALYVIYQLAKGVVKLIAIVLLLALLYTGYLSYTGRKMPQSGAEIIQRLSNGAGVIREKGGDMIKKMFIDGAEKPRDTGPSSE
ncbi:MAG TPA: hypothetical protein PKO25_06280 [Spirochaetota bacterium]|jgi:hypothetical protein|nr:hypothetical protein [Spirochaetota bacterium]OPZ39734.1 MAG: hypothetical protein BWY96_00057 [Spirochaetes bacterium ADurb.BinA120]HNU91461.1 hypothetical protein [Spirochaetota bacterium]HPV96671.1 hypothetical protein [Spirochaetota bacterium]